MLVLLFETYFTSYLSLALAVHAYGLVRPTILDDPEITIIGGRNLLHDICVPSFVTNDTKLKGGFVRARFCSNISNSFIPPECSTSMMLITGPNSSGKSVYLKQVAQIVFLAHIGCFVPARTARVSLSFIASLHIILVDLL